MSRHHTEHLGSVAPILQLRTQPERLGELPRIGQQAVRAGVPRRRLAPAGTEPRA